MRTLSALNKELGRKKKPGEGGGWRGGGGTAGPPRPLPVEREEGVARDSKDRDCGGGAGHPGSGRDIPTDSHRGLKNKDRNGTNSHDQRSCVSSSSSCVVYSQPCPSQHTRVHTHANTHAHACTYTQSSSLGSLSPQSSHAYERLHCALC